MNTEANTESGYRYPGSRPFYDNEIDRRLFFGRNNEKESLLNKVLADNLVVLYGRSGLGKTSLINAGLNQPLRDRGFIPLTIRLNNPDLEPLQGIYQGIKEIVKQERLDYEAGEEGSLWQYFKTAAFWSEDDKILKPVLIIDQFEEFYMLHTAESRGNFIRQLADLVNNNIPEELLEAQQPGEPFPYSDRPPNVKILLSLREDHLAYLEEMSSEIPAILSNRFRLMPLSLEQARQAIIEPSQVTGDVINAASFTFTPQTVDIMLEFLCKRKERSGIKKTNEVESFQLQLLCRHIEEHIVIEKASKQDSDIIIEPGDLGGEKGMQRVLQRFYDDQIKKSDTLWKKRRARKLCEKGLISTSDLRISLEEGEINRRFNVSRDLLVELVNSRLLRSEPRVGSIYYELSHDTLIPPIRESKRRRISAKKIIYLLSFIYILIILIFFNTYSNFKKKQQKLGDHITGESVTISRYSAYGSSLFEIGKFKEAIRTYEGILEIDPGNIPAKISLAEAYLTLARYEDALSLAKKVLKEKNIFIDVRLSMRFVALTSLIFQGKKSEAGIQLKELINFYKSIQEEYKKVCRYTISKNLIKNDKKLQPQETRLLLKLIEILEAPKAEGDKKLKELESAGFFNI